MKQTFSTGEACLLYWVSSINIHSTPKHRNEAPGRATSLLGRSTGGVTPYAGVEKYVDQWFFMTPPGCSEKCDQNEATDEVTVSTGTEDCLYWWSEADEGQNDQLVQKLLSYAEMNYGDSLSTKTVFYLL